MENVFDCHVGCGNRTVNEKNPSPAITMSYGFKHAFVEIVPIEIKIT